MANVIQAFETIRILDINLFTIDGIVIDLSETMVGLLMYENLFEKFLTGTIYVSDTVDMYKNRTLSGDELLQITFEERTTGIRRVHDFYTYKINYDHDVTQAASKFKILEISFISAEMQINSIKKISKKFWDYPDTIVESIVRTNLFSQKQLEVDYTANLVQYYAGYHRPSSVIDFCAKQAISEAGMMDYVFYESLDGFHFVPISFLLAQEPIDTMVYMPKREMTFRSDDMRFFKQDAYFDINMDAQTGVFGKTLWKINDNDRYGVTKTAATYADNAARFTTQGRNLLFRESLFNAKNVVRQYLHNHDVAQVRQTSIGTLLHNNRLMVRASGTFDRHVGDIISVEYPNQDNIVEPNTSLDGSWIVLAIKHNMSAGAEYTQNLMLAKNARNTNDNLPAAAGNINIG